MSRKTSRNQVPDWLWFFIALPVSLITLLLMRNKKKLERVSSGAQRSTRYTEPDSIPLNMDDVHPAAVGSQRAAPVEQAEETPEAPESEAPPEEQIDDLKVIEGIGPSIAGLLRESGIRTYHALATTPVDRLNEILTEARLNHLADPSTWAEQARLAADEQWEALDELQKSLKGGRKKG